MNNRERIKQFVRRPETRKWLADKIGGAIVAQAFIFAVVVGVDHFSDGELEIVAAILSLVTE